ncbi:MULTISPECIES: DUF6648 family protein [Helcococcus]|uniref:DUF6648 family protein n=2 Tax=Helcococcus bovis TaxID=3153252 RepID=A0ABW9F5C9_9FIRM
MYLSENDKLNKFIKLRNKYIDLLNLKKINKSEFNHNNNEIFSKINLRPFTVLDSFNKALYNYNYYNTKAKLALEEFKLYRNSKNLKKAKLAENAKLNNYYLKDQAIIAMIELEESSKIEAYYVIMHSKNLKDQIFEIYFKEREKVILHTKNEIVKKLLISKRCFKEDIRQSLIDSYINN